MHRRLLGPGLLARAGGEFVEDFMVFQDAIEDATAKVRSHPRGMRPRARASRERERGRLFRLAL